jgi:hypothetical protein
MGKVMNALRPVTAIQTLNQPLLAGLALSFTFYF